MKATERLYLTAGKDAVVGEGSPLAATLWASVGDTIPDEAAARFGVVDGRVPVAKSEKEKKTGGNKERKDGGNKDGDPKPDDLTKISGIGAALAKKLNDGGVYRFADVAAAEVLPQHLDKIATAAKWADWRAQAAELIAAAETGATEVTGDGA